MFGDALGFPLSGDEGVKSIVIGGVLLFLSFLLVPILPIQGYLVRAANAGLEGRTEAPAFDEWDELFVDGVKILLVGIIYFLTPFLAALGLALAVGVGATVVEQGAASRIGTGIGLVGALAAGAILLLFLVAVYVFPAAVVSFSRERTFGDAFDFDAIISAAFSADYFVAGLLAVLLSLVVSILTYVLTLVTFGLFVVVAAFVQFYVQVAFYYLFGRGYAKATRRASPELNGRA